jgi:hypothetical protein
LLNGHANSWSPPKIFLAAKAEEWYGTCVVSTGKVVSSVFIVGDELLWMEELAVCPRPHFVNDSRLQIDEQGPWDVLP